MTNPFHLAYFLSDSHAQSWGRPWSGNIGQDWMKPDLYVDIARQLERACFDYILLEDNVYIPDNYDGTMDIYLEKAISSPRRDPLIVAPWMLEATKHIGIVPTISTFAYHPYLLARLIGSLDQLSGGRAGWNVVTGSNDQAWQMFGYEGMAPHDERYDMAAEFMDAANALWDSWEPDAVIDDREGGRLVDPSKVHRVDFNGRWYKTRGPLNSGPAPQGRPIVAQAGSSGKGREFAARYADTIVVEASNLDYARTYRQEVRELAAGYGRNPDEISLMLLVSPVIAESSDDLEVRLRAQRAVDEQHAESTLASLSKMTGIPFGTFPLDEPLSTEGLETNGTMKTLEDFINRNEGRTLREAAVATVSSYNSGLVGTPGMIADKMEDMMNEIGGDGFLISGRVTRKYIAEVTDGLVPELQRRGLVRTEYTKDTLHEHLTEF